MTPAKVADSLPLPSLPCLFLGGGGRVAAAPVATARTYSPSPACSAAVAIAWNGRRFPRRTRNCRRFVRRRSLAVRRLERDSVPRRTRKLPKSRAVALRRPRSGRLPSRLGDPRAGSPPLSSASTYHLQWGAQPLSPPASTHQPFDFIRRPLVGVTLHLHPQRTELQHHLPAEEPVRGIHFARCFLPHRTPLDPPPPPSPLSLMAPSAYSEPRFLLARRAMNGVMNKCIKGRAATGRAAPAMTLLSYLRRVNLDSFTRRCRWRDIAHDTPRSGPSASRNRDHGVTGTRAGAALEGRRWVDADPRDSWVWSGDSCGVQCDSECDCPQCGRIRVDSLPSADLPRLLILPFTRLFHPSCGPFRFSISCKASSSSSRGCGAMAAAAARAPWVLLFPSPLRAQAHPTAPPPPWDLHALSFGIVRPAISPSICHLYPSNL
ncbi:hypothetical protein C7M84_004832 [Penaeus vannamei]|uniref:Uncharacterized protein n=1 Tax=Penaeus vannamei TaxID=6689 RepID=A0A3R7P650_PENVA|nr:hypothetical protein C7M84_004832 [Penaeus vannamei]